jgi:hypothetical protein
MPRQAHEIAGDASSVAVWLHTTPGLSVMKINVILEVEAGRGRHFMRTGRIVAAGPHRSAGRETKYAHNDGRTQPVSHHQFPDRGDKRKSQFIDQADRCLTISLVTT